LALDAVERELTRDPPYGAKVTFSNGQKAPSFRAPIPQPWLDAALDHAAEVCGLVFLKIVLDCCPWLDAALNHAAEVCGLV
jgi:hypothetical protein